MQKIISICSILFLLQTSWLYAQSEFKQGHDESYANETAIEFVANDGQTTEAYQGFFEVPENRNKTNSRTIKLGYVRFPAAAGVVGSPIIYLAGGPGGSGIGTAKWRRFPLFMALRQFGDVIALDQRGTGISEIQSKCSSAQYLPVDEALTNQEMTRRYRLAAKECVVFWQGKNIDVLGYTTVQNALDLDALRLHLKAQKMTLWGISYGSHLALAAIDLIPERIDKVIIASAEGLDQTVKLPAQTDSYFSRVQAVIDHNPEMHTQYPDIIALIKRVHSKLDVKPIKLAIPQRDGQVIDFLLQKTHLQMLASMMIADPNQNLFVLLDLYSSLDSDNTDVAIELLKRGMFNNEAISFDLMPFAMDVASGISDKRLTLVTTQASTSLLGEFLNFPMPQLNNVVDGLDLGERFRQPVVNSVPTLLLTGTLDGRTYIEEQQAATQHLSQLTQVMVVNAGHNLFMSSPEVLKVMQQFLANKPVTNKKIIAELSQ
ncbi:alpha/beta fold hydrolase [Paraglaciecola hydrolytica]|uniref:Alpha/beta hydrolase n=1 Tax=Paraglaciecola hydrolytica TaxID=1799789 RepID=A0A136A4M2_9ALTE|nr:alpha/beta hydrolase [Paraglaciecola hydrolytica]KXI30183.1 alpha/beta hydrolase [Paraglaciecola hydrolytica]